MFLFFFLSIFYCPCYCFYFFCGGTKKTTRCSTSSIQMISYRAQGEIRSILFVNVNIKSVPQSVYNLRTPWKRNSCIQANRLISNMRLCACLWMKRAKKIKVNVLQPCALQLHIQQLRRWCIVKRHFILYFSATEHNLSNE